MWASTIDRISGNTTDFSWPYDLSISAQHLCLCAEGVASSRCSPRSPTVAPSVGLETLLATLTPLQALLPLRKLTPEGHVPQASPEARCPQEDLCWPLLFSYIILVITSTAFTTNLVSLIFFFLVLSLSDHKTPCSKKARAVAVWFSDCYQASFQTNKGTW